MDDPIPIPIPNFHPPFDNDLSNFPEFDDVTAANLDDNPPFDVDFDFDLSVDDLFFADSLLLQPDPFNSGSDDVRVCDLRGDSEFDSGNCSSDLLINSTDCGSNIVNDGGIQLDLSSEIRVSDVSPEIVNSSSHSLVYRDDNGGIQLDLCPKNSDQIWLNSGSNSNDNDGGINLDTSRKISDQNSNNNDGSGNNLESSGKISDQNSNNDDSGNNLDLSRKISDQNSRDNSSSGSVTKCGVKSKRKKGVEYDHAAETRSNKIRRSGVNADGISSDENVEGGGGDDEEEKRKARMIRNRESAHLSRQRKKQYVEELEDKVKAMVSTISDLNGKISYFMTENANLRQQLCGGGGVVGAVNGMYPAYPMPGMAYPWMPYPPPGYMVNPHGSKVPLLPIPRVKSQQPAPAPKVKKSSKGKTKKVASVSLFGLLFFMLLFGGLVPLVNVRYGKVGDVSGVVQKGSVFKVDNHVGRIGHGGQANSSNGGNASEPLVASLYVPRNDKLVKIDGNLIIQSVLVSEKALASEETGLALHGSYPPYPTPGPGSNDWRHPYLDRNQNGRQRALGSGSTDFTPIESDGKLPQWFREGLAGPMLSSGMCTQVFQFDVSPTPRSIVPAPSLANTTSENRLNYTRPNSTRNRRILKGHDVPHYNRTLNTTKEQVQPHERSDGLQSNKTGSSVVVSVLVDPREIGDSDGESVIGSKTLSRIFVVVLVDSVKYVTYSCVLPFMGPSSHLITT